MAGFVKSVGKVFKPIIKIGAPIVGGMLGGPAGAALGGALGQTVTGGNRNEILMGGVTSGLGAYGGNSAGNWLGKTLGETSAYSKILGTGALITSAGTSVGAGLATYLMEKKKQDMYNEARSRAISSVASLPSFDDIKTNAVNKTEEVFEREHISDIVLNRLPKSRKGRDITIYNKHKYRPLKEMVKKIVLVETA